MSYPIGSTIAVTGDSLTVALEWADNAGAPRGVPGSMEVAVADGAGGAASKTLIGQPGSFIAVQAGSIQLLCMITAARLSNDHFNGSGTGRADRLLEAIVVGTIRPDGGFERGADTLPTVGASAFALSAQALERIYASQATGTFSMGKLSQARSQDARISLDAFLSRHAAIVGQTGAGKSWTVASVLQKIGRLPQASVVLLDLHGEYHNAFGDYATYVKTSDLELPYWLMNCEELIDMCIERHESAAPLQIAKFKELLQDAKQTFQENRNLNIPMITVDTPVYFEFSKLFEEMQRLDTEVVLVNLVRTHGPLYGHFTRTISRLQSRLNDRRFDLIFNPKAHKTTASMEPLLRRILGEESKSKNLTVLDLSQVPFEVRPSVISLILRCLFDFAYWYKRKHGVAYPLSVFCDEAHTYLNDADPTHKPSRISAERIAKEGRKYGISLAVITQRPREVSSTLLSQCSSFLCLRLSNPDDQAYVRNLLPDSMKGVMSIISTLRRGEAFLVGDAVMMPTRIQIEAPNPTPDSQDVSFARSWSQPHQPVDIAGVLDLWRRQGV